MESEADSSAADKSAVDKSAVDLSTVNQSAVDLSAATALAALAPPPALAPISAASTAALPSTPTTTTIIYSLKIEKILELVKKNFETLVKDKLADWENQLDKMLGYLLRVKEVIRLITF